MKKIGRYEILSELGRGAMGVVYKASDPTIGRMVAIKVLSLGKSTEQGVPGVREIFMREARAAGRLSHPGIVTIHDALEDPETESSYIVMEFIPGRTLEDLLVSGPQLETEKTLEIIRQIADGLDYAHRQQVIHRDLKPANILLTEDGRVKITDFGIAKIAAAEGASRTIAIMGTPSFMSPEQVTGREVDARSDLFSLGIMFYLVLTGQKPFVGDSGAVMFKIVYEDPILPSKLNPKISPEIDYVVLRCLAKDRDKRYSNARELLDDLEDVLETRAPRSEANFPITALRTGERTVVIRPTVIVPLEAEGPRARRKLTWAATGIVSGVVVAALLSIGFWQSRRRRVPTPAPTATQVNQVSGAPSRPGLAASPSATATGAPSTNQTKSAPAKAETPGGLKDKTAVASASPGPRGKPGPQAGSGMARPQSAAPRGAASQASPPATSKPVAAVSPPPPPPSRWTAGQKVIQLWCRHELKEGSLTISSGGKTISQWPLKGKKKGGFLGIKGGYSGTLSRSITIPAGARDLSVHVVSPEGAVDLSKTISAIPPPNTSGTLQVVITGEQLTLNWQTAAHP